MPVTGLEAIIFTFFRKRNSATQRDRDLYEVITGVDQC